MLLSMDNGPTIAGSAEISKQSLKPADAPNVNETSPVTDDGFVTPAPSPIPPSPPDQGAIAQATPSTTGIGVLLVNLGTPDAPTPAAVRRYLKQFLTDQRVIEKDSLLWKMMLNGVILPVRSRRKARDYEHI